MAGALKKVSIALAAYNGEKYIKEQIDSILNQTYRYFELIVCDDCSTDSTWDIIQEYERKDGRIHCYLNEINLGFKKNFEKAIGLCTGEFIALSDQDDIWLSNHLEVLLENIGNNMLCCGDAEFVDQFGLNKGCKLSEFHGGVDLAYLDNAQKKVVRIIYLGDPYQGASMLLRKAKMQNVFPVPEKVIYHDAWFALCASAHNSLIYVNTVITKYRQHGKNASGNKLVEAYMRRIVRVLKRTFITKKDMSDRLFHCNAVLERFADIDNDIKDIILQAQKYFSNRFNFFNRISILPFLIKNSQWIYLTKSKRIVFMHLIKHLFFN
jgi:glycosyltransferase involved in cell wall biosynthesis